MIYGLLKRTVCERFTIHHAILNGWLTQDNAEPIQQNDSKVDVSNFEINSAIKKIGFGDVVKLKTKMGSRLKGIRRKISTKKTTSIENCTASR